MNFLKNPKKPARLWVTISGILLGAIVITIGCKMAKKTVHSTNPLEPYATWTEYGGGADQSKYTELNQINKKNVSQLKVAWNYPTMDNIEYTFNPIIVDTIMYVLAKNNSLVALNAINGKEIWIHTNLAGITRRGINYWESKDRKDRRLIFSLNNTLQEIDALTGKSILSFGTDGYISLKNDLARDPESIGRAASSTPGQVFEDLIILGSAPGEALFSAPGHLRAYNVITGKLAWVFHSIPLPGEEGYETWPKDAYKYVGGVNCWGEISIDAARGIAYFPMGSPTYDYYGADRQGQNLFSDCILALDARTGKRLWHYQLVHHDLWDYDITAAPQLITVKHDGKMVDAVAVAGKQGFLYVFDRVTGKPLWPIEERPVPQSDVPGEHSWPTQPFPTVIPPYNRQNVTVNDLNPFWDKNKLEAMKQRVSAAKTGLYTPLSTQQEVIAMPGATGGANFGNTASNPKKGIVYVAAKDHASFYKLTKVVKPTSAPLSAAALSAAQSAYAENCQTCHGANRQGGIGPNIVNISNRINLDAFKVLVTNGRAQMPPLNHIDEATVTAIYRFLGGNVAAGPPAGMGGRGFAQRPAIKITGPVVASGGAPAAVAFNAQRPTKQMRSYPEGVTQYDEYSTPYGLSEHDLLSPPWSFITAYDLNTGTIKWKKGLGQNANIPLMPGQEPMGTFPEGSQRKGMIVTSTGILFATAHGGQLFAYDADNGNLLWTYNLPMDTDGMMATYEINGKQYLVVSAMRRFGKESVDHSKDLGALPPGYIVLSIPDKGKRK